MDTGHFPIRMLCVAVAMSAGALSLPVRAEESGVVAGQVMKIDLHTGLITIKHGPIKSLNLGARESTHDFKVKEPMMLNALHLGERFAFTADRADGASCCRRSSRRSEVGGGGGLVAIGRGAR